MSIDLKGQIDDVLKGSVELLTGGSANIQSKTIYENGTYNPPSGVDGFAPVIVDVPQLQLEDKYINANGQYGPSEGYDGFRSVTVEVPVPSILPLTITENGYYESTGGSGFNPITVNVVDNNINMGNCFNQWVQTSMRVSYFSAKYFSTFWDGGSEYGCQLYSNFDISNFDLVSINGESITPHSYNPNLSDEYKVGIGFSTNLPTSYADINYIRTPNYYLPADNESFSAEFEIPDQTCYLVLNLGGWNLRNVQIELVKNS